MRVESPAPPVYLDGSALVKLLVPEPESDALNLALLGVEDVVTAPVVPLRTLDALHVALALEAAAATLVTYDPRLRDAASSQGLFVAAPPGRRSRDCRPFLSPDGNPSRSPPGAPAPENLRVESARARVVHHAVNVTARVSVPLSPQYPPSIVETA